jgi:hypothetical protein
VSDRSQLRAVSDVEVQPVSQAGRIKNHGLTVMDVLERFSGGLRDDGARGGFIGLSWRP